MHYATKAAAVAGATTLVALLGAAPASAATHNYAYLQAGSAKGAVMRTYTDGHCSKGRFDLHPGQHKRANVQSFSANHWVKFKSNRHGYQQVSASNVCVNVNDGPEDYVSAFAFNAR
jgi:hypothetical protein